MCGSLFGWLLSLVLAFFAGASLESHKVEAADTELQQKVQGHMDVIVDEVAGIVDDVNEEVCDSEPAQKTKEFVDDVKEIAQNTADDIEAHFGSSDEEESVSEAAAEAATETVTEAVTET